MRGKEKCKALKEIRAQIAKENDIAYAVSECTHQGDCKGTCPKCEAELRYLERELDARRNLGKAVAVVGISAGLAVGMTGCSTIGNAVSDVISDVFGGDELEGDTELASEEVLEGEETYMPEENPGGMPTEESSEETMTEVILEGDVSIEENDNLEDSESCNVNEDGSEEKETESQEASESIEVK